jgi:hypothetical protein
MKVLDANDGIVQVSDARSTIVFIYQRTTRH